MEKQKLLFIGCDVSGIQKFIYNITSKKAMVSLKGRSNYLVEKTKEICTGLENLSPIKNSNRHEVIYCSGGKFYLIADDTAESRSAIEKYSVEVEKKIWEEHKGQLGVSISYVPFSFASEEESCVVINGQEGGTGALWKEMTKQFQNLKNIKFANVLLDEYDEMFEVQNIGGDVKVCAITGIEDQDCVKIGGRNDEGEIWTLKSVAEQIKIGEKIRNKEKFKDLEEYADEGYLGVLRMDVDGLGSRFINGFDNIREYKRFSEKLQKFFGDNLYQIQRSPEFVESLNIVYAGGDDIFAVGRWDKIIDFASVIRNEFKNYTEKEGLDGGLSISGGVAIVGSKYPIAKSAEIAGDAEEAAKKYRNGEKNAFNMFGVTVSWNEEFDYVRKYKDDFVKLIKEGLNRSIIHQVMRYANVVRRNQIIINERKEGNNKQKQDYKFIWHAAYYLTRFMSGKSDEIKNFCKDLRDKQLVGNKIRNFELMSVAARWAELELRQTNNN